MRKKTTQRRSQSLTGAVSAAPTSTARKGPPRVFISYTHENDDHKRWVRRLATDLQTNHVEVTLDQWMLRKGADLMQFMERGVADADRVLLILTPQYRLRADQRAGGVGYESLVITGELARNLETIKFIGILRSGTPEECVPTFLSTRLHIDFREENTYPRALEELLRDIFDVPGEPRPSLGEFPFDIQSGTSKIQISRSVDRSGPALTPASPTPRAARVDFSFQKLSTAGHSHLYALVTSVTLEIPPTQGEWLLKILWPEEIKITHGDSIKPGRQVLIEGLRYKELVLHSDRRIWPGETIEAVGPKGLAQVDYRFDRSTQRVLDERPRDLLFTLYLEDHRPVDGRVPFSSLNCL